MPTQGHNRRNEGGDLKDRSNAANFKSRVKSCQIREM